MTTIGSDNLTNFILEMNLRSSGVEVMLCNISKQSRLNSARLQRTGGFLLFLKLIRLIF